MHEESIWRDGIKVFFGGSGVPLKGRYGTEEWHVVVGHFCYLLAVPFNARECFFVKW